ncbi:MAG: guanylate kinase [Candidatus Puniceispirillaceae bacterium]
MSDTLTQRRGLMLVLSSPSGAGKSSISRQLLSMEDDLTLSVSATTRTRRPGEVDGKDYHFTDLTSFQIGINKGEFLEYAKVFDNYYGTPRALVEDKLASGQDVLFDIDWQGTQQLAEIMPEDLVKIFILPPSVSELEKRLLNRAQDTADVVAGRMAKASDEMSHYPEYDYIIVNHDLALSVEQVQQILHAERLKRNRQIGLSDFVKQLRNQSQ